FLRRQRHRRRRPAAGDWSCARLPHAGRRHRHRLLLWGRRRRRRRIPREHESGSAVAAAGVVRVRKQSLCHGNCLGAFGVRNRHSAQGRVLSHSIRGHRRNGCGGGRGRSPPGDPGRARNPQALFSGMPHLSIARAFDVRSPALPRQGRGRIVAPTRADRPLPRMAGSQSHDPFGRALPHDGRDRCRNRAGGRLRRGRDLGAGRATVPLRLCRQRGANREAVRAALADALCRDKRVFLMGEDIGRYGGCYAVSHGLLAEFGPERIRDTPLSESGFTGAGIGAAMAGMRPVVELMTVNFSLLALDQILNTAATVRHMSGNQFGVPLVIRMATGAGRQLAAQHSHSLEGWYAHIPGIKVLAPATLEDARGMLWTALQEPDPVLIFENVMLYNMSGKLAADAGAVNIDRAAVRRQGNDISLITYGGSLWKTLEAATALAAEGIEAEVIDLRSLRPLDDPTIMASVGKTRHAVIIDEGWRSGSLAAEIGVRIVEQAFWSLDAPIGRVCSEEVPIPYPRHLENAALPQAPKIVAAAKAALGRA